MTLHRHQASFDYAQDEEKFLMASRKALILSEVEGRTLPIPSMRFGA
ncbi:MAG TPA: hypothetical protein VN802_08770 [Stellaceae bacterium]|nr:hypothetical protein [Stellaceae bacterium]